MTTAREKTVLTEFIELYRKNTCLWKVKVKEYMDKNKKDAAYKVLLGKLKELNPDAVVEDVKKKINSLRSCFRKEYKKTIKSMKSGAGTEEIYESQLRYYDLLMFLKDHEIPKSSVGTSNPEFLEEFSQDGSQKDNKSAINVAIDNIDSISNVQSPELPQTPSTSSSSKRVHHKKIKTSTDSLLELVSQKLDSAKEDQHDIFGKNVAEKLRHLDPTMRIFAEKLINEVLFEGQMESLNRRAYICIPSVDNHSNRGSCNEVYVRQPTYQQSVQIQENLLNCNEPTYSYIRMQGSANSEETTNSIGQYYASYQ